MLEKFNKMLANEIINENFIGMYIKVLLFLIPFNIFFYVTGEGFLSLWDLFVELEMLVFLYYFIVVLIKFIYSIIKEKVSKK